MANLSLDRRFRQPEIMDQPGLADREHHRALNALRRVNRISHPATHLWRAIAALAREQRLTTVRVLDIASGGGDIAITLAKTARRHGIDLAITGCDISPVAIEYAQQQVIRERLTNVQFRTLDALRDPLPTDCDVVMCSLFLHHLDEPDAVLLLRRMAAATRRLILVDDLRRCRLGYAAAWLGCRLLTRSHVVHFDGPVSVAGAFTTDEAADLCRQADLADFRIANHWPWRFLLSWRKTA